MRRSWRGQTWLAACLLLLGGCGHVLPGSLTGDGRPYDFARPPQCSQPAPDAGKVEVRYLGSGGVYIRWRGDAILIGPSFSNPGLVRAGFGRMKHDRARIARGLEGIDLRSVRGFFAGHSHYDHIGDLPVIAGETIPDAPIWVNATGVRALAGEPLLRGRVQPLGAGETVVVTPAIRVRAVASGHAPQVCPWRHFPCVYASGELTEPWTTPLSRHRLGTMRGGETLALVIELGDGDAGGDTDRYRIYYNDAAADSPLGQTTGDFDLAILCIAQWNWVRDYPRDLLAVLRPAHVVVSHWENFFVETRQAARFVPNLSNAGAARFLEIVDRQVSGTNGPGNNVCGVTTAHWTMPAPGSSMLFEPRPLTEE